MRLLTTAILAFAALVLAVMIHRVNEQPVSGKRAAELANVLVRYDPEAIEKIEIERNGQKCVLEKHEDSWFFSEPEKDRVDMTAVTAVLDRLNHLGIVETVEDARGEGETESFGWEGEEAIHIRLMGDSSAKEVVDGSIVLGAEAPRTGSIYARREGRNPGRFLVDGNPRPWLETPLATLRDRHLLPVPAASVVQIVIRRDSGEISLQRKVVPPLQDWAIASPIVSWADHDAMDRLLSTLANLQIQEVAKVDSGAADIPNPIPPDAAVVQVRAYGVEKVLTLYFRKVGESQNTPPLLEAHSSERPVAFQLHSNFLDLLPKSANDLRDRTLARLPAEFIDTIRIQSRVDPLVDLRASRRDADLSWKIAVGGKLLPANASEVSSLLSTINQAAIQRFVTDEASDLSQYGLVPPQRRIIFDLKIPGEALPDGSPGPVRELSRTLDLGWKDGEEQHLYANFVGEPHVYELDPTFLNFVPTHPIKWKSLSVLTFNPIHLVSISRKVLEKENLKLAYDYRKDEWQASRNGVDITPSIDINAARRLRDRLGSLTANSWYLSLATAYEALQTPSVEFQIVTSDLDRATNQATQISRKIEIAPAGESLYFGRLTESSSLSEGEGSPDVFIIDHETYRDLIRPVTTPHLPNKPN